MSETPPVSVENRRALKRALIATGALAVLATAVFFHFRDDSEPPANPFPLIPENPAEEARWKAAVDRFEIATKGLNASRMDAYDTRLSTERLAVQGFKVALEEVEEFAAKLPEATALLSDPALFISSPKQGFASPAPGVGEYRRAIRILRCATAMAIREKRFEDAVALWEKYGVHRLDTDRTNLSLISLLSLTAWKGIQNNMLVELAYADTSPERIRRLLPLVSTTDSKLIERAAGIELEINRQSMPYLRSVLEKKAALAPVFKARPFEFEALGNALAARWHGMNYLPNATLRTSAELMKESCASDAPPHQFSWAEKNLLRNNGGLILVEMSRAIWPMVREKITRDAAVRAIITRTALAIRLYELEHGKRPATLTELAPQYLPAVPTDPYDGKPLRYDAAKGWLWALGKDLKDDAGDEEADIVRYLPGCEPPDAESVFDQEKRLNAGAATTAPEAAQK